MRHTKKEQHTSTRDVTTGYTCDHCSKEIAAENHTREGTTFVCTFGYGSRYDTNDWKFDLCDDCCDWLKGELKHVEVESW